MQENFIMQVSRPSIRNHFTPLRGPSEGLGPYSQALREPLYSVLEPERIPGV